MVSPVDRNLGGAELRGFNAFQVDTGRADRALASAGIGSTVADVAGQANRWAGYVRKEEAIRVRAAESAKSKMDVIDLENRIGPVIDTITKDADLSAAEKRAAFEEAFSDLSAEYKYHDPDVNAAAELGRATLKQQGLQGLEKAILHEERSKNEAYIYGGLRGLAKQSVNDPEMAIVRAEDFILKHGADAGWDAARIEKEREKAVGGMMANHVRRRLADPLQAEQTYTELLDESKFPDLDPASRTTLINMGAAAAERVQRDRIAAAEKADRMADRAAKEMHAANAAQFRVGIMGGGVTEQQLTAALQERKITLADFNQLLPALRNEGEQTDDPATVVQLTKDVLNGTADSRAVFKAWGNGRLSKETAEGLLTKVDSVQNRGGVLARDDVKRGRDYVDAMVGGVRGPMAILDSQSTQRVAGALSAYDEEIQREDELARAEGRPPDFQRVRDRVVSQYKPDTEMSLQALPRPRYAGGARRAEIDLPAAKAATLEAFQRGEMTPDEMKREVELLRQYETLLNQPQPTPRERR